MQAQPPYDDANLIRAVQTATPDRAARAFETLAERYHSRLLAYLRYRKALTPDEVEDVANETWARALEKISKFKYMGVDLFPWLRAIADRVTKEQFRSRYIGDPLPEDSDIADLWANPDPAIEATKRISHEDFRKALEAVLTEAPQDYRNLIEAKFFNDFKPEEIGQLYDWSMNKVYVTTYRAVAWLRQKLLERYGQDAVDGWLS